MKLFKEMNHFVLRFYPLIAISLILIGIFLRVYYFLSARTLWYDEAMLTSGILRNDLQDVFALMDYSQSAPVGYVWIVRFLSHMFGNHEYVLRLVSIISGILAIWLFYRVLVITKVSYPLIGTAFFATLPVFIRYSSEVKPYALDVFVVLLLFLLCIRYREGRFSVHAFAGVCFASVWFSFPSIFVIGALGMTDVLSLVWRRGRRFWRDQRFYETLYYSIVAGVSFLVTYFLYTQKLTQNLDALSMEYWRHLKFPIFPHSLADLILIFQMIRHFFEFIFSGSYMAIGFFLLFILGFMSLIQSNRWMAGVIGLTALLIGVASSMGRFPIQDRLLLFFIPFVIVTIFVAFRRMTHRLSSGLYLLLMLTLILISNRAAWRFFDQTQHFLPLQETRSLFDYLQEDMTSDDRLYLFPNAIPYYEYRTGYTRGLSHFPTTLFESGTVIYGIKYWDLWCEPYRYHSQINQEHLKMNVDAIRQYPRVYLLFQHQSSNAEIALVEALEETGDVVPVMIVNHTPLYQYIAYE